MGQREMEDEVYLGIEGEKFTLDQLTMPFIFHSLSVKDGKGCSELAALVEEQMQK